MPVLNWIGKDKVVNHDKELPFRVLKPVKELSVGKDSENLLIEGDNLEALKALMPFYYGKIKCIYIDPPYNTGNEKWVYNDKVNSPQIKAWLNKVVGAEGEDLCRHDKWLCMMYPRLKLLRDLLAEDGAIFISIDNNEQHHLRLLMDEIFGEDNFRSQITWQRKYSVNNNQLGIASITEFILVYSKTKNFKNGLLPRTQVSINRYKNPDKDKRGPWKPVDYWAPTSPAERPNLTYIITNPNTGLKITPTKKSWKYSPDVYKKHESENRIWWGSDGKSTVPALKLFLSDVKDGLIPPSLWLSSDVGHTDESAKELQKIFGNKVVFDTPKPIRLIKRILQIATDKNSIILDSFAGSGTTAHAVMELNKEDGGNRKVILVELEKDIARNVTANRLKRVSDGYDGALFPEGTGQGFQYLDLNGELYNQTGFVNPDAKYEDMAAYIYFTETKSYLDIPSIENPFIGSQGSTSYFLFFEDKGGNILDEKTLKKTDGYKGSKVIYADKCLLDDEFLEKHSVTFKQIPYELKKY